MAPLGLHPNSHQPYGVKPLNMRVFELRQTLKDGCEGCSPSVEFLGLWDV